MCEKFIGWKQDLIFEISVVFVCAEKCRGVCFVFHIINTVHSQSLNTVYIHSFHGSCIYVDLMPVPNLSATLSLIFKDYIVCCSCPVVNVSVGLNHPLAPDVPAVLVVARRGYSRQARVVFTVLVTLLSPDLLLATARSRLVCLVAPPPDDESW